MTSTTTVTWVNGYGSTMALEWDQSTGNIVGTYKSDTGSTGEYVVWGQAPAGAVDPKNGGTGVPLSLSIYWRSTAGGTGDPTWNWVSGLSGMMVYTDQGALEMTLIHNMVAPNPVHAGALNVEIGAYADKLIYVPQTATAPVTLSETLPRDTGALKALATSGAQTFTCIEDPTISFDISLLSGMQYLIGTLTTSAGTVSIFGQYNWSPTAGSNNLQALSFFCATTDPISGAAMTVSMSGWIDTTTNIATLTELRATGQVYATRYVTTRTRTLTFA